MLMVGELAGDLPGRLARRPHRRAQRHDRGGDARRHRRAHRARLPHAVSPSASACSCSGSRRRCSDSRGTRSSRATCRRACARGRCRRSRACSAAAGRSARSSRRRSSPGPARSEAVFWVLVASCFAVVVVLLLLPDPERVFGAARLAREASARGSVAHGRRGRSGCRVARRVPCDRDLSRGAAARGLAAWACSSAMRASRTVILPLWAVSIGMPPEAAALVIGVSAAIDFALFYVSGQIMDRFGRLWGAIPGLIGLGTGHLVLALTHDLPDADAVVHRRRGALRRRERHHERGHPHARRRPRTQGEPGAVPRRVPHHRRRGRGGRAARRRGRHEHVSITAASATMGVVGFIGAGPARPVRAALRSPAVARVATRPSPDVKGVTFARPG